ncbi:MAG: DNA gyrase inhibitor YacG [bacterium]
MSEPLVPRETQCPNCGQTVTWTKEAKWRPFCSEQCRLIDLGEWFNESHRIPVKPEPYQ